MSGASPDHAPALFFVEEGACTGRIHNRDGGDADAPRLQMQIYCIQHAPAQIMLFQSVPELADGRLIRRRGTAQIPPAKRRRAGESSKASSAQDHSG